MVGRSQSIGIKSFISGAPGQATAFSLHRHQPLSRGTVAFPGARGLNEFKASTIVQNTMNLSHQDSGRKSTAVFHSGIRQTLSIVHAPGTFEGRELRETRDSLQTHSADVEETGNTIEMAYGKTNPPRRRATGRMLKPSGRFDTSTDGTGPYRFRRQRKCTRVSGEGIR
jgi:hypothetical protein